MRNVCMMVKARQFSRGFIRCDKPIPEGINKSEYKIDLVEAFYDAHHYGDYEYLHNLMNDAKRKNVIINNFRTDPEKVWMGQRLYKVSYNVHHGEIFLRISNTRIASAEVASFISEHKDQKDLVTFVSKFFDKIDNLYD